MNRILIVPPLLVLLAACSKPPEQAVKAEPAKAEAATTEGTPKDVVLDDNMQRQATLEFLQVKPRSLPLRIEATGRLAVNEERSWHVGAIIDGKILKILVNPGDRVKRDQVLAGLHSHDLHEGRAQYRKATNDVTHQRSAVIYAQRQRDRYKRLFDLKAASQEQLDHAEAELKIAQNLLANNEIELERTRRHLVDFLQVSPDDHDDHKEGEADHDNDLILVKSPADGVVLTRKVSVGSVTSAGEELFEIADLGSLWMIASLAEEHLSRVRTGMHVRIKVQAYPDQWFSGRISRLGEQLDPETRTVPVRVELTNPNGKLKPEMFAAAELDVGGSARGIFIDETAVQQIDNQPAVFVRASGNKFLVRAVTVGKPAGGLIEIVSGLQSGETIVTRGSFLLKSQLLKGSLGE
ncbi:MAG: efflux RND transporter periplasmic adaptor subunit [Acidobacteria bacterium]|nr:efflux RND transporter periplasmic adaptor subunit [Acidobacteriota bacterium]